jgi:LysM repeat protein
MHLVTAPLGGPLQHDDGVRRFFVRWLQARRLAYHRLRAWTPPGAILDELKAGLLPDAVIAASALQAAYRLRLPDGEYLRHHRDCFAGPLPTDLAAEAAFLAGVAADRTAGLPSLHPLPAIRLDAAAGRVWAEILVLEPDGSTGWRRQVPLEMADDRRAGLLTHLAGRRCQAHLSWQDGRIALDIWLPAAIWAQRAAGHGDAMAGELPAGGSRPWDLPLTRMAAVAVIAAPVLPAIAGEYTVRAGDTLWGIARQQGDGTTWQSLYHANRQTVRDPDLIYPDQVLHVPGGTAGNRITVRPGDCLWDLAARHLGNAYDWSKIWRLNRDQLHSPRLIYPGMSLRLPAGARTASAQRAAPSPHRYHPAATPLPAKPAMRPGPHAPRPPAAVTPGPSNMGRTPPAAPPNDGMAGDAALYMATPLDSSHPLAGMPDDGGHPVNQMPPVQSDLHRAEPAAGQQSANPAPSDGQQSANPASGQSVGQAPGQGDFNGSEPMAALPLTERPAVDGDPAPLPESGVPASPQAPPAGMPSAPGNGMTAPGEAPSPGRSVAVPANQADRVGSQAVFRPYDSGAAGRPDAVARIRPQLFRSHVQLQYSPLLSKEVLTSADLAAAGHATRTVGVAGGWRLADPVELAGSYVFNTYGISREAEGGGEPEVTVRHEHHARLIGYYVLPVHPQVEVALGAGASASAYGTAGSGPAAGREADLFDASYQRVMATTEAKVRYQPIPQVPLTVMATAAVMPYGHVFQATPLLPDHLWGMSYGAGARYTVNGFALEARYRGQMIQGENYQQGSDTLQVGVGYEFR